MLATTRQLQRAAPMLRALQRPAAVAAMPVIARSYATPVGPPPPNFRLKRQPQWDEEKESTLDRVGKYFLMNELFRGMYILMEQFFRPP